MPSGRLGKRIEVVARLALLATGQVRRGQLSRQPPIAFRAAGQHQQVRAGRVRLLGAGGDLAGPPATVRRRTRYARRVPRPLRRIAPLRTGRRDRSARGRADPAGQPLRPALPACWPRRGSCTPNAHAARHTQRNERRTSGPPGRHAGADTSGAYAIWGRLLGLLEDRQHTGAPAWRGLPSSTRSISAQLGGPLNQPTSASLSKVVRYRSIGPRGC